jgi:hypothetical protein
MKRRIVKKRRKTALRKINKLLSRQRIVIDLCLGEEIVVVNEYKAFFDSSANELKVSLIKSTKL